MVTAPTKDFTRAEPYEALQGGAATSMKRINNDAFSHHAANLTFEQEMDFKIGNAFFRRLWVSAPATTQLADGLGPLYNARSCQLCHLKDGRGHPPKANWPKDNAISLLVRLSIPPQTDEDRHRLADGRANVIAEPTYGMQLQEFAVQGHQVEGRVNVSYEERDIRLSGGDAASLRIPIYRLTYLGYGPLHKEVMVSPRVASPMIGLGLLDAISEEDLIKNIDIDDLNGDGISGKANEVWSFSQNRRMLGRFGWKAGSATILDQSADAFAHDIGISTSVHPAGAGECTKRQEACVKAVHGGEPKYGHVEAPDNVLNLVNFYASNLAVPNRRDADDPTVLAGKKIFYETGCTSCHTPKYVTQKNIPGKPELSGQLIWPYTDLLLHDMGKGLADNRPEGKADGREWRTPPLWGIGLTKTVNGHTNFLHDGRARNLLEAILWHDGEAEAAKQNVIKMKPDDRRNLIRFLGSL